MVTKKFSIYGKLSKALVVLMSFYFAFPLIVSAQSPKKANIWYFGDRAGLDFTNGNPVPLTNGALQSFEGSAVAASSSGELLFYTNGGSTPYAGAIWNRNHQMMPNGNLANAGGCNSSFQSALILPMPRSASKHFVFTTDCMENNATGGLRYNIVDMNLDGGLGDVVVKGVKLTGPVDESLTAIQHQNGQDWWVVTHKLNTDSFYVYNLTSTGIAGVVKTKIGLSTPDYAGAIVASSNGQRMVHCGLSFTTLYNFDNATGRISNPVYLGTPGYSAAFSPDCKLVYVADGMGKNIYQYDVTATNVSATKVTVGSTAAAGVGYLQLGPDGKIYVAKFVNSTHLGVIEQPNKKGLTCFYVDNGISLGGRLTKGGLPNFPNNYVGECGNYIMENVPNVAVNPAIKNVFTNGTLTVTSDPGRVSSLTVMSRKKGAADWSVFEADNNIAAIGNIEENTEYEFKVVSKYNHDADYTVLTGHNVNELLANNGGGHANPQNLGSSSLKNIAGIITVDKIDFTVSPNPADQFTNIEFKLGNGVTDATIRISDTGGNEMMSRLHQGLTGNVSITLDLSSIPTGFYFVSVTTSGLATNKTVTKKLIVTH